VSVNKPTELVQTRFIRKWQEESHRKVRKARQVCEVFEEPPRFVVVFRLLAYASVGNA
jgi:hypothetical protein